MGRSQIFPLRETNAHPVVAGKPSQVQLEKKPAWDGVCIVTWMPVPNCLPCFIQVYVTRGLWDAGSSRSRWSRASFPLFHSLSAEHSDPTGTGPEYFKLIRNTSRSPNIPSTVRKSRTYTWHLELTRDIWSSLNSFTLILTCGSLNVESVLSIVTFGPGFNTVLHR